MLEERAQIEAKYADNLTKWANTWKKNIDTSPEEAQMKSAWLASANEAENIARLAWYKAPCTWLPLRLSFLGTDLSGFAQMGLRRVGKKSFSQPF